MTAGVPLLLGVGLAPGSVGLVVGRGEQVLVAQTVDRPVVAVVRPRDVAAWGAAVTRAVEDLLRWAAGRDLMTAGMPVWLTLEAWAAVRAAGEPPLSGVRTAAAARRHVAHAAIAARWPGCWQAPSLLASARTPGARAWPPALVGHKVQEAWGGGPSSGRDRGVQRAGWVAAQTGWQAAGADLGPAHLRVPAARISGTPATGGLPASPALTTAAWQRALLEACGGLDRDDLPAIGVRVRELTAPGAVPGPWPGRKVLPAATAAAWVRKHLPARPAGDAPSLNAPMGQA